mmetsp:Transcript_70488/g.63292  ORF Transcript_70488/g.63292 Transcript_70488/m.63292 type:complete len:276 (-) Transcript_70488:63-890(-)
MANLLVSFILSICLYLQIAQSSKLKIVGGTPVKADQYPFIAYFHAQNWLSSSQYQVAECTGSILRKAKPAVILTAAHCIHDIEHPSRQVTYDESYVLLHADTSDDPNGIKKQVSSIKVHPDYAWNHHPDVALVFINEDLTPYTQLSTVFFNENFDWKPSECCSTGDDLTVIGYGKDCDGCPATPTLEAVDIDYLTRSECNTWYSNEGGIFTDEICTDSVGRAVCHGDSGGPLIRKNTNEQVGLVSHGSSKGCDGKPDVYTDIGDPDVYKWIYANI